MFTFPDLGKIAQILSSAKTIAIVGLSPKVERPSNIVGRYLLAAGYTVIPVNPGHDTLLEQPCYPDLASVPGSIDIVDIFRRSEEVYPIVSQAVEAGAKVVWMQQGIRHEEAAAYAEQHGLQVIMDRCIKDEHLALDSDIR